MYDRYAVMCHAFGYESLEPKLFRCGMMRGLCYHSRLLGLMLRWYRVLSCSKDIFVMTLIVKPDDMGQ